MEDGDELHEVLREHERSGHCIGRLVALPALERRAIRDGEQREPEARDEEGGGDGSMAGVACERRRGEAKRDRPASPDGADAPQRRRQEARSRHRRSEDDQAGHEKEKAPVPLLESLPASTEPRAQPTSTIATAPRAATSSGVSAEPTELRAAGAHGRVEEERRKRCDRERGDDAAAVEERVRVDLPCG